EEDPLSAPQVEQEVVHERHARRRALNGDQRHRRQSKRRTLRTGGVSGPFGFLLRIRAMPDAPELSILMPVYNEIGTAERAIADVLEAKIDADFELIVVDDGSTDGTRELLLGREWPERV